MGGNVQHGEGGAAKLRLPACLIIMDGFGLSEAGPGNAISLAETPALDEIFARCPTMKLEASGEAVGLPDGQMGNSEVGHLNIGAGRVVYQELTRINRACADGSIVSNEEIQAAYEAACAPGSALHLMGLLSDGGVHSSNAHLYALIEGAVSLGVPRVFVHCFLDGRDVAPTSGSRYVAELEERMSAIVARHPASSSAVSIASVEGRYFAMDRDNRWDRVERAYRAIVCPRSADGVCDLDPVEAVEASYADGVTDEFVEPLSFNARGVVDGDAVVFFNFRPDRARELTRALVDSDFAGFERPCAPRVHFTCLTEYDPEINAPVAFKKEFPGNVLADVLSDAGLRQFHIAETEKYAHVTFFLNGGIELEKAGEERKLIASPKVATYDLMPQMSEPEVARELVRAIEDDFADVYIVNFANCDMVGHTGVIPAAVEAVEAVDRGVGQVVDALTRKGGVALLTADHGNADKMISADGSPHTAHTTAPVPLALIDASGSGFSLSGGMGCLADIAPTLLNLIGLECPVEMTGRCLIR